MLQPSIYDDMKINGKEAMYVHDAVIEAEINTNHLSQRTINGGIDYGLLVGLAWLHTHMHKVYNT
jgi:hypothetical protein